ncbi:MAG: hypothetical protein WAQ05_01870, partial [Rubrivivax sp.]
RQQRAVAFGERLRCTCTAQQDGRPAGKLQTGVRRRRVDHRGAVSLLVVAAASVPAADGQTQGWLDL